MQKGIGHREKIEKPVVSSSRQKFSSVFSGFFDFKLQRVRLQIADCRCGKAWSMGQECNDAETRRNGETETGPTKAYRLTSFPRRRESRKVGKFDNNMQPQTTDKRLITE
jgi:hypothetical protein